MFLSFSEAPTAFTPMLFRETTKGGRSMRMNLQFDVRESKTHKKRYPGAALY